MKKEIDCAVDNFHRIAFGTKKNGNKYIPESKLSLFISVLTELLFARYEKNWYPENPERGSGYRCIRINTQCVDPTILESLKKAKISRSNMVGAVELTIWVDPGIVSVRIGEDGSIGTEVVDEEVHRLGKMKNLKLAKSGSTDTDPSSRSSSPGASSDRSQSNSPTFGASHQSRSSPVMEYNPYCPPARINYPARFQQQSRSPVAPSRSPPMSSPAQNPLSTPPPKSVSPLRSFPASPMAAAVLRPSPNNQHIPPSHGSPLGAYNVAADNQSPRGLGNIPMNQQRVASYTRPRAIFPSDQSLVNKAAYNPYALSMASQNMPSPNFYDIPAMA